MELYLGVDIGGTDVKMGVVAAGGEIVSCGTLSTRPGDGAGEVASRVAGWFAGLPESSRRVAGAGLDCAGLIDAETGMLHFSPNLPGWSGVNLADVFGEALGMEVRLENDVNAACWGEYRYGAGKGTSSFVTVTLGTGVGGGIVVDGRLYRGAQGMAGEIGHQVIVIDGAPCACGNRGCVEAYVGASSITARVLSAVERGEETSLSALPEPTVRQIADAAGQGDAVAASALADAGAYLGAGLANVVHIINPEVIAVGGGVAGAGELILGPARESMRSHLMSDVLARVRVVPAALGNNASFIGAASLAAERDR